MATFALPTTGALHRDGWLQQEFFTIVSEAKPATHGTPKARAAELAPTPSPSYPSPLVAQGPPRSPTRSLLVG